MAIVAQATQDRARLGIVMTLGAYAFFTLIGTSVKWLVLVVISHQHRHEQFFSLFDVQLVIGLVV